MDLWWRNVTCEHCTRPVDGLDGVWAICDRILLEEIKKRLQASPSIWRFGPGFKVIHKAWFSMFNGLLGRQCLVQRLLHVSSSNQIKQLGPEGLAGEKLEGDWS